MVEIPHRPTLWIGGRFFWETICFDSSLKAKYFRSRSPMISKGTLNNFISVNTIRLRQTLACILIFLADKAVIAAPFVNGSFEQTPIVGIEDYIVPGDSQLTGWAIAGPGSIARIKGNARFGGPDPADGLQHLCFNGGVEGPGMQIFQDFETSAGTFYQLSFRVGRRGTTNGIVGIQATVADSHSRKPLGCISEFVGANDYNQRVSVFFTAESDRSRITFTDTSPDTLNIDVLLDDVRVSQTTPPNLEAHLAIELKFSTTVGYIYRLQGCARLGEEWQNVGEPFIGTGQVTSLYKSAADPGLRLYRLLLESDGGTGECVQASSPIPQTDKAPVDGK
jgi:hypothetical protein